jgi:hypothetical protein
MNQAKTDHFTFFYLIFEFGIKNRPLIVNWSAKAISNGYCIWRPITKIGFKVTKNILQQETHTNSHSLSRGSD